MVTPSEAEGVCGVAFRPNKASVVTPYKEVLQEVKLKKKAAQPQRAPHPHRSEEDQRQIVHARDRRLEKESEARKVANTGRNWMSEQLDEFFKRKAL